MDDSADDAAVCGLVFRRMRLNQRTASIPQPEQSAHHLPSKGSPGTLESDLPPCNRSPDRVMEICSVRFGSNIQKPKDGWMRFRFSGNEGEIDLLASYTPNDPFHELITALQAVFERGYSQDIRVNEEPHERILNLAKSGESLVLTLNSGNKETQIRIEAGFHSGCREIARNIYHLYEEIGYDGFVREWRHKPATARIKQLWADING